MKHLKKSGKENVNIENKNHDLKDIEKDQKEVNIHK